MTKYFSWKKSTDERFDHYTKSMSISPEMQKQFANVKSIFDTNNNNVLDNDEVFSALKYLRENAKISDTGEYIIDETVIAHMLGSDTKDKIDNCLHFARNIIFSMCVDLGIMDDNLDSNDVSENGEANGVSNVNTTTGTDEIAKTGGTSPLTENFRIMLNKLKPDNQGDFTTRQQFLDTLRKEFDYAKGQFDNYQNNRSMLNSATEGFATSSGCATTAAINTSSTTQFTDIARNDINTFEEFINRLSSASTDEEFDAIYKELTGNDFDEAKINEFVDKRNAYIGAKKTFVLRDNINNLQKSANKIFDEINGLLTNDSEQDPSAKEKKLADLDNQLFEIFSNLELCDKKEWESVKNSFQENGTDFYAAMKNSLTACISETNKELNNITFGITESDVESLKSDLDICREGVFGNNDILNKVSQYMDSMDTCTEIMKETLKITASSLLMGGSGTLVSTLLRSGVNGIVTFGLESLDGASLKNATGSALVDFIAIGVTKYEGVGNAIGVGAGKLVNSVGNGVSAVSKETGKLLNNISPYVKGFEKMIFPNGIPRVPSGMQRGVLRAWNAAKNAGAPINKDKVTDFSKSVVAGDAEDWLNDNIKSSLQGEGFTPLIWNPLSGTSILNGASSMLNGGIGSGLAVDYSKYLLSLYNNKSTEG